MSKVDTSTWKPFRVGDLFDVEPTKGVNTYGIESCGDIPYIAASRENNGCQRFVDCPSDWISEGNCLVFVHIGDAAAGVCHYIDKNFVGMKGKTSCAYNEHLTSNVGLFLASVITANNEGSYSFSESWTGRRLLDTQIFLPATSDGEPDWAYMETYMQQVLDQEELFAEHLTLLTAEAIADGHELDTSQWKAFHLYDVFEIDMGNKFDKSKMPIGDTVNFIGRTGLNNGVNAVCGNVDGVLPYNSGLITLALGGTIGACFVQTDPFYTSQNVIVLIPPIYVGLYARLFAASSIYISASSRYKAFSDELNRHIKSDFTFMLPATPDGEPDWAYMETYMQQVLDREELFAEHLTSLMADSDTYNF